MHPAWTIHEIVGEIASYLGVPSLRKLAVTCRTLYPPCEEALWALQGSLKPLMRFLPPDLVRLESFDQIADDVSAPVAVTDDKPVHALLPETFSQTKQPIQYGVEQQGVDTEAGLGTAVLRRLPVESDFDKFSPRALRMRYLRFSCSLDRLELLTLGELQKHIDVVAMFANLDHIKILSYDGEDSFNAPSGLLSKPSHISIQHMARSRPTLDFPNPLSVVEDDMCSVLRGLEDGTGNGRLEVLSFLTDVQIFTRDFNQRFKGVLLQNSSSLKTVELSEFPEIDVFYALMGMPQIDSVVFGRILTREVEVPVRERQPRGGPPLVAPHLRSLRFIGRALGVRPLSILKHWECPELREVFFSELVHSVQPIQLTRAVAEVAPGVRRLEIDFNADRSGYSVTELHIDAFRPLLRLCPHLEHLYIRLRDPSGVILGNEDVDAISHGWPNLRYLYLDPRMSPYSKVTLEGLLPFARNCPNLEELHLALDATITHFVYDRTMYQPDSTEGDGTPPTPSKLRVLDIGAPLVHSTQMCAEFLNFLFPSIVDLFVPAGHEVSSGRKFAWDIVALKVLRHVSVTSSNTSNAAVKGRSFCEDDDYYECNSDWEDEETGGNDSDEWDEAKLEAELNKDA